MSGSKIKNKSELPEIGNYPVYSSDNNGVVGYTDMPTYICDESRKFYVVFGDHTRTFNIATKSFSILDNVKVLKPLQRVSLRQLLTLSQILCKHPFQLNGDRLGDHQNQS
ncbi:hypothetical protein ACOART_11450 [Glaesserella parasuis]|uniref:hypothetical protein n=1 Tax=Glaesserella parasuis TaxID=738 RepID=UPI0027175234|nr:hypothetical protein [Glaesserella parasuis]